MAIAKKVRKEPSCPLWLATYGDLVTNMLVFFVLLLSMSEIKKEELFVDFMRAVKEAFGYVGGLEQMPLDSPPDIKNVPLSELLVVPIDPEDFSPSPDEGVIGRHNRVVQARPPKRYDQGGKFQFRELSDAIDEDVAVQIADYAAKVRGLRTLIEVRGHCNPRPVDGTSFADHFELSYRRARAIADGLVTHGVDAERIVVVAASTHQPVTRRNYTATERQANDIVEVVQLPQRVEQYVEPEGPGDSGR